MSGAADNDFFGGDVKADDDDNDDEDDTDVDLWGSK